MNQTRITRSPLKPINLAKGLNLPAANKQASGIREFDNALSGGLESGSLILLGGEPGIGKSTLTLQICAAYARANKKVLYVSGEESLNQVAGRARRVDMALGAIGFLQEYSAEVIAATVTAEKPDLLVIDSIQVIHSEGIPAASGSVSQVRRCAEILLEVCKRENITALIIGHVTKDGNLAGPRVLEHLVDTVIQLEGSRDQDLRLARVLKNRFGPTNEVGILAMEKQGLISVDNPSGRVLAERPPKAIGSALTCVLEGNRPLLVEIQALCTKTVFGYPKRSSTGYDLNRLNMMAAIIQKYLGLDLLNQDIYINVVGGFRVQDPAADLAVAAAIISSLNKIPLPENQVYLGETGLSGEIRASHSLAKRLAEIKNLGLSAENKIKRLSDLPFLVPR